jgi:hypothetical protein
VRVGIEATGSMQWFVNLKEELGVECRWVIPRRFERPNHENKNMIGEMRTYSCHYWWKSAFRRSGTYESTLRSPGLIAAPTPVGVPAQNAKCASGYCLGKGLHQGAGGYGLLGRCLFNLDLVRPVHHYFSGVPREPRFGFVYRTDLLYPQR